MPGLKLVDPTGYIQGELQKSIDLVSFGLQAAERLELESLAIPDSPFQLTPAGNKAMDVEDAREEFGFWVLGNGLRDCADAIGPSLEWARKVCFLWTRQGDVSVNDDGTLHLSAQLSGKEWNEQMVREGVEFAYWPLRKRIGFLSENYGLQEPAVSEQILSISYARNCLTHRRGIVGEEDVRGGSDSSLVVNWKTMELTASGDEGSRVLELPASVEAGEMISMSYADISKEFKLGQRIMFSAEEFLQIATTFLLFAVQIQESIRDLQQARHDDADKSPVR